ADVLPGHPAARTWRPARGRVALPGPRPRRVRRDDPVRGKPPGQDSDAPSGGLQRVRGRATDNGARDQRAPGHHQPGDPSHPQGRGALAALTAEFTQPLRSFDLDVALEIDGTVALVGPSGAGKTSVLRAVAGLMRPATGRIALGDDVWFDSTQKLF